MGFVLLLIVACVFYVPLVAAIYGSPQGDPAHFNGEDNYSVGWVEFFEMLFGIPLWLALGGMMLFAGRSGRMPVWAIGPAAIIYIAAGITVWAVSQVYIDADGGISVVIPALLPLLVAGYAAALRLPAFERLPPDRVSRIALVAGGIAIAVAIPLSLLDLHNLPAHVARDQAMLDAHVAKEQAESARAEAADEARFKALTSDSPLKDYMRYVHFTQEGDPRHAAALAGARLVKSRQADAVQLLDEGKIGELWELWEFDLQATPALCAAYDRALQRLATNSERFDLNVGDDLKYQLPNIKFFAAGHCDLDAGLNAAEARVQKIVAVPGNKEWEGFLATLVALHPES